MGREIVSEGYGEIPLSAVTKCVNFLHYSFNENSTLLDIGSGSGKVLLCMQAMLPFSLKKVYGTEIVKFRSDFANNLLNKHKEHLGKHNITFANSNFNYDDFIQNGT